MTLTKSKQQEYLRLYEILLDCEEQTPEQIKNYEERVKFLDRPLEEIHAERTHWLEWAKDKVYENLVNGKIYDEETGQVVSASIDELKEIINQQLKELETI